MVVDEFVKSICSEEAINVMVFAHEKNNMGEELIQLSFWDSNYYDCKGYHQRWWSKVKDIWSIIRTGYPLYHKEYCILGIEETKELIEVLNRAIEAAKPPTHDGILPGILPGIRIISGIPCSGTHPNIGPFTAGIESIIK